MSADSVGDTVVVTATRFESRIDDLLSDVSVIGRDEIESAGLSSLGELLQRQPGIQLSQAGGAGKASSVYVRGADSGHVLVLVDGVRTGSATLGLPSLEHLPLDQIERIEIVRGPASALYGSDAIGGVIQIFTRKGGGDGVRPSAYAGAGTDGLYKAGAGVSGGAGRWTYQIGAGYLEEGGISSLKAGTGDPDEDGYRQTQASGALAWHPASGHEVGASFTYSKGRSWIDDFYDPTPGNLFSNVELSTISLYSRNRLSDWWQSTVRLGQSSDYAQNHYSLTSVDTHFQTVNQQLVWQNDFTLASGTAFFALEHLRQDIEADSNYGATDRETNSAVIGWNGMYGAHSVQANLRHDDSSAYGTKNTGSLAYGHALTDMLRVRAAYGTSYKAPTFNDQYWPYSSDTYFGTTYVTQGNPSVLPEAGRNREFALVWDNGRTSYSATYYLNKVRNLIDWQSTQPNPTTFVYMPTNVESARIEGVTLQASTRWAAWKGSAVVDFLKARDEETGDHLQRRADRTASLRLERAALGGQFGGEVVASGGRYSKNNNQEWMGGYGVVNLFGRYPLSHDWSLEGRIDNLFNKDYELIRNYNTRGISAFLGIRYAPR